ncbi:cystathionine gamma-synthase [Candidatus Berkiella aquae]|uniref:Cystathionine beta-lyase n=1 Tax=Candidatus Berkiella aquae TaxID=295108 RepID=A0A0Q9YNN8_9GAMM|nr:cystathionine gamma-synthase [Candidatus Berkiella aquae]MCS5712463.1 cystathionine gamma-synthase [Candidatus Berkiella aquae]
MVSKKEPGFATKAIHAGFSHDKATGAVMPPIYMASTYAQLSPGHPISKYEYSRTANPTRDVLEANLATLENGRFGLCFASGCAALNTLLQALPSGSHVIISDDVYGGTLRLLSQIFTPMGLHYTQCDMTDINNIEQAINENTQLIWLETPSNPLLKIIDITAVAQLKQQKCPNAWLAVDNTFATPYLQTPLDLGADIVCHSTTKYIGGHSDVIGGALIVNNETLAQKLYFLQNATGSIPSPMDCYLLLRSIKTLHVRMNAHCHNAKTIAKALSSHPKVSRVIYPGLSTHPEHYLATKQMRDFGGMISITLTDGPKAVIPFLKKLKIFTLAESLGGVESLIEHPAVMTHAAIPAEHRKKIGIEDSLIRISVGIEAVDDLLEDLNQAL